MWDNLKASIASVVRTNDNQEITGANLQNVLNTIVNTIGANATFAGIAVPSTNPGTPDGPVFYIACEPGVYSNFNLTLVDGLYILENKTGSWVGTQINTGAAFEALIGYYNAVLNGASITVPDATTYRLTVGGDFKLKMSASGTTDTTLTIGNATNIPIWYNGAAVSSNNTWETGEIISVFYDGTRFMASNSQGDRRGTYKYIGLKASITIPSVLPTGYTVLDYIANTSSSGGYIDTGIKPNDSNWKFEGSWMLTGTIQPYQAVIASYSTESANTYRIIYDNTSTTSVLLNANTKASPAANSPVNGANGWNTFSIQYGTATINGTAVSLGTTAGTAITNNMRLFSNSGTNVLIGRMRRFKAWHSGTLVRDMIPCINPQNVYGMYDIVNGVFYGSSNANSFTGGN